MSVKQDRTGVRTPAQLEQKYNFGKTFSDMLGLINDSRDKVDEAKSELQNAITQTSSELSRTAAEINAQVKSVSDDVNLLSKLKLDSEAVSIAVRKELKNVDQVVTESGYRFDSEGLTISKSGEQMKNVLDNTGMYVTHSGDEILTANDKGVNAVNLQAKTYLIIGEGEGTSRFENYGILRTGCFWVGG